MILVIEDEENIQKLIKANLAASGHEVLVATSGEEGLRLAQERKPGLILLDLMMPGISGWDVLNRLKAVSGGEGAPPIIIITAAVRPGDAEKARAMGDAGYLTKPFTADELLRKVQKAMKRKHHNASPPNPGG